MTLQLECPLDDHEITTLISMSLATRTDTNLSSFFQLFKDITNSKWLYVLQEYLFQPVKKKKQ